VDLNSQPDGRFLVPWEHDEPARMGSHTRAYSPIERSSTPPQIHADALAYEGLGRASVCVDADTRSCH
jgi:hypothetical protein